MKALILLCVFALSFVLALVTNWLAMIPWRRAKQLHWTERARLLYPVAVASQSNTWFIPIDMALGVLCIWRGSGPHWLLVAFASWLGCLLAGFAYSREVYPGVTGRIWLRQAAGAVVISSLQWFVLLAAIAVMPGRMGWPAWTLFCAMVAWYLFLNLGGLLTIGSALGIFVEPPERLRALVGKLSARLKAPVRRILLWPVWVANAFALPSDQSLVFTGRLVELLPDDELASIIAHELAHLTEARDIRLLRLLSSFSFLPLIFINPLAHAYGWEIALLLPSVCVGLLSLTVRFRRKMETRADKIATESQTEAGIYARALMLVHEANLVPMVTAAARTHPHLYDRVVAAGVTPDFPRPRPSARMAWHGQIFSAVMGLLIVVYFLLLQGLPWQRLLFH